MTGTRAFSMHYRDVWEERSGDPTLPAWLRVASLAYGMHKANGHATFRRGSRTHRGDIATILAVTDEDTGELVVASPEKVRRAIDSAVEYRWLAAGSNASCLIVPAHAVTFNIGNPHAPCTVDHGGARRRHDRPWMAAGRPGAV